MWEWLLPVKLRSFFGELWGFFLLCLVTGLPRHSQAVADAPLSPRCAAEGSAWPSELCLTWEL